jgi:hypothetical protein
MVEIQVFLIGKVITNVFTMDIIIKLSENMMVSVLKDKVEKY